jgi:hypothetical protein
MIYAAFTALSSGCGGPIILLGKKEEEKRR